MTTLTSRRRSRINKFMRSLAGAGADASGGGVVDERMGERGRGELEEFALQEGSWVCGRIDEYDHVVQGGPRLEIELDGRSKGGPGSRAEREEIAVQVRGRLDDGV